MHRVYQEFKDLRANPIPNIGKKSKSLPKKQKYFTKNFAIPSISAKYGYDEWEWDFTYDEIFY